MRKILFILLIICLCAIMYLVVWSDVPELNFIHTYSEVKTAYDDYQSKVQKLEEKNNVVLPSVVDKLKAEYSQTNKEDLDNVIKKYKENKKAYDDILATELNNIGMDNSDIYNIDAIWAKISEYAKNNNLDIKMDIEKSELNIKSSDFDVCNLNFEIVGTYQYLVSFLQALESDQSLRFQLSNFSVESYNNTIKNQIKSFNKNTDNMSMSSGEGTETSENQDSDKHKLDLKAKFRISSVPLLKKAPVTEQSELESVDANQENTDETTETE